MKYFVVYDEGKGPKVFPTDDYDSALQFAAHQKVNGAALVKIAESMPGELVLTARLVAQNGNGSVKPANGTSVKKPTRKAAKLSRPKGAKRTPGEINKLRARVLSWVQTNPGQNIEELGKALNIETKELVLPMRKLLADKAIRKRGKARATRYFPAPQNRKPAKKKAAAESSPKS